MDSGVVVPAMDVFIEDGAQLGFVPDKNPIQHLSAQSAVESLNMGCCIGSAIRGGDAPDSPGLGKPEVQRGTAGDLLAVDLGSDPLAELAIDAIVIVDEELWLLLERGVPDLLLDPGQGWVLGHIDLHDFAAAELHDDEDVEGSEPDRVLDAKVAHPDGVGLVPEEGSPGLGWSYRAGWFDHVLSNCGSRVLDAELDLQLQGDAILAVLRVAGHAVALAEAGRQKCV